MFNKKLYLSGVLILPLLGGCFGVGSTDPSQGGFFSYNPKAYEERLRQREDHLAHLDADTQNKMKHSQALERNVAKKSQSVAQQEAQLRSMRNNVANLQARLKSNSSYTSAQNQKLAELRLRADVLQKSTQVPPSQNNRQQHLENLQREYSQLQSDMDALLME